MQVLTEEQYLSINGACRQSIGEAALHKNKGRNSDKTWRKMVDYQASKDRQLLAERERLRIEFAAKVEAGEMRQPSRVERLIATAQGMDELASVQAARAILEKQGINWKV